MKPGYQGITPCGVCVCCGALFPVNEPPAQGWGSVKIGLTTYTNVTFNLSGPICLACADKAKSNPAGAMAVLRVACPNVLASPPR